MALALDGGAINGDAVDDFASGLGVIFAEAEEIDLHADFGEGFGGASWSRVSGVIGVEENGDAFSGEGVWGMGVGLGEPGGEIAREGIPRWGSELGAEMSEEIGNVLEGIGFWGGRVVRELDIIGMDIDESHPVVGGDPG